MKILRITTFLDFGGIETKMVNLSTVEDQHEWIFCAIGKGGQAAQKIRTNGKRVVILSLDHKIINVMTLKKVYDFIRKEKPDVIHTAGAEANFYGFFAGKLAGVPKIITEEIGISEPSRLGKIFFKYIFNHATYTVGESRVVTNHLKQLYNIDPSKLKVISNFGLFETNTFNPLSQREDIFKMIMISRLEPVKNITGVIHVVKRLVNEKIPLKLTIAGDGSLTNTLKEVVMDLGLQEYVDFIGYINNPYLLLSQSDLYILNSFTEGFSNSLIEAMYSRTPALSTSVGSAPEFINDGVNGFLVAPDDETALYQKIKEIINTDYNELKGIATKGQQTVLNHYTLANHLKELYRIYS